MTSEVDGAVEPGTVGETPVVFPESRDAGESPTAARATRGASGVAAAAEEVDATGVPADAATAAAAAAIPAVPAIDPEADAETETGFDDEEAWPAGPIGGETVASIAFEPPKGRPSPPVITVLQPLTPLKDVDLPKRPPPPEDERAMLATWSVAMERALRDGRPGDAVRLAHVLLRNLPRHLATYYRLIRAAWMLRRWEEGDAWGRRLLRADPASALAWRAVAMGAEFRGERARAHARWQRAFECDPYEPEIRAGLVRTSVDLARLPVLGEAGHAALLLRGYRWEQAALTYYGLTQKEPRRLDFQSGHLIALWQLHAMPDAYDLARRLAQAQPYMLAAWLVIDQEGDANDKALARHPLSTMDPDGDYVRVALGISVPARPVRLYVTDDDKALLESVPGKN